MLFDELIEEVEQNFEARLKAYQLPFQSRAHRHLKSAKQRPRTAKEKKKAIQSEPRLPKTSGASFVVLH